MVDVGSTENEAELEDHHHHHDRNNDVNVRLDCGIKNDTCIIIHIQRKSYKWNTN